MSPSYLQRCKLYLSSHTLPQIKPTTLTLRRPKPKKIYRCDCTRLCKDPNGAIVSERTWFRHAEYRDNDATRRRSERERERELRLRDSIEPADQDAVPSTGSNKRRRLDHVSGVCTSVVGISEVDFPKVDPITDVETAANEGDAVSPATGSQARADEDSGNCQDLVNECDALDSAKESDDLDSAEESDDLDLADEQDHFVADRLSMTDEVDMDLEGPGDNDTSPIGLQLYFQLEPRN